MTKEAFILRSTDFRDDVRISSKKKRDFSLAGAFKMTGMFSL